MISIDQITSILNESSKNLTEELGGKIDFMLSLLEEDDWSLIIKSHALIESVLTELIMTKMTEDKIKPIIERIPLHDSQVSKMKLLKAYSLMSDDQAKFIQRLSEIRNSIVHKFENISFSLDGHVISFDKNQKKSWAKDLMWHELPSSDEQLRKSLLLRIRRLLYGSLFLYSFLKLSLK